MSFPFSVAVALWGCSAEEPPAWPAASTVATATEGPGTIDDALDRPAVRIDGADPLADPHSTDVHMCVTRNAEVYVLWVDDRRAIGGAPPICG